MGRYCLIDKVTRIDTEKLCVAKQSILGNPMLNIFNKRVGTPGKTQL